MKNFSKGDFNWIDIFMRDSDGAGIFEREFIREAAKY